MKLSDKWRERAAEYRGIGQKHWPKPKLGEWRPPPVLQAIAMECCADEYDREQDELRRAVIAWAAWRMGYGGAHVHETERDLFAIAERWEGDRD